MEIKTSITINTTPEKVWSILTDFENYGKWNPFIISIVGDMKVGNTLQVTIAPPNTKAMKFKTMLLVVNPQKELRWIGKLLFKGLFDGEHFFYITHNENGTVTFTQGEKFTGMLVPFFKKMIHVNTRNGFVIMNEKLKEKVEGNLLSI
jgi:hypothetical protein